MRLTGLKNMLALSVVASCFLLPATALGTSVDKNSGMQPLKLATSQKQLFRQEKSGHPQLGESKTETGNRVDLPQSQLANDVAWVVDSTALTIGQKEELIAQIKKYSSLFYRNGGRMALVIYRTGYCKQIDAVSVIEDFTLDSDRFDRALDSIKEPYATCESKGNSSYAAVKKALRKLKWKPEGLKKLVLVTTKGYEGNDYDGTNLNKVIAEATKTQTKVRVFPLTTVNFVGTQTGLERLAKETGGSFTAQPATIADVVTNILQIPVAILPLEKYQTTVNVPLQLDLSPSYIFPPTGPASYEFDCDSDGKYDLSEQTEPYGRCQYSSAGEYKVTARIVLKNQLSSTVTAQVKVLEAGEVTDSPEVQAEKLAVSRVEKTGRDRVSLDLQWASDVNPHRWLVTMGKNPVGNLSGEARSVEINNILASGKEISLYLAAVNADGTMGSILETKVKLPAADSNLEESDQKRLGKEKQLRSRQEKCVWDGKCFDQQTLVGKIPDAGSHASGVASIAILATLSGAALLVFRRSQDF